MKVENQTQTPHQNAEPVPAPKSKTLAGEKPGSLLLTFRLLQQSISN